jgi:hypothetical protein
MSKLDNRPAAVVTGGNRGLGLEVEGQQKSKSTGASAGIAARCSLPLPR